LKTLVEKKAIVTFQGKLPFVKILGNGEITKKLTIEGLANFSRSKGKD
jgi:ribosomal protein L15